MHIERVTRTSAVVEAQDLFDGPARVDAAEHFLASPDHHLLIAYEDRRPVGFVSGVEVTHPDKGTEMFLYELAVDDAWQGRGPSADRYSLTSTTTGAWSDGPVPFRASRST